MSKLGIEHSPFGLTTPINAPTCHCPESLYTLLNQPDQLHPLSISFTVHLINSFLESNKPSSMITYHQSLDDPDIDLITDFPLPFIFKMGDPVVKDNLRRSLSLLLPKILTAFASKKATLDRQYQAHLDHKSISDVADTLPFILEGEALVAQRLFFEKDASLHPQQPPPDALEAKEAKKQVKLQTQKPIKAFDKALLHWLALKAAGLSQIDLSDEITDTAFEEEAEPLWRIKRQLLSQAQTGLSKSEILYFRDSERDVFSTLLSPRKEACYQWIESHTDRSGPCFQNPMAAALWIIEKQKGSDPSLQVSGSPYLLTPEGQRVSANHGFCREWAEKLVASIEQLDLNISSQIGQSVTMQAEVHHHSSLNPSGQIDPPQTPRAAGSSIQRRL